MVKSVGEVGGGRRGEGAGDLDDYRCPFFVHDVMRYYLSLSPQAV